MGQKWGLLIINNLMVQVAFLAQTTRYLNPTNKQQTSKNNHKDFVIVLGLDVENKTEFPRTKSF